ncbi:MAG TPA: alpha-2-macroglobulin family protein, partial [Polyangiaceae bacterium]
MQQNRVGRRASAIGFIGVGILASCFGGRPPSVPPSATLSAERSEGAKARSSAPFAVVHAGPRGEVTERAEPAITVLFNRAMRTLDTAPEDALSAFDVRTRGGDVLAGSWRWVGTHGALFTPDRPLPGGTEYQVTVPANAHPLDGTPLGADYHFEFRTPRPTVLEARPAETDWLRPDSAIVLTFNQAIDPAAFEKLTHLVAIAPDGVTTPLPFHAHRQASDKGAKESARPEVLVVQPASPLPRDRALEVRVPAGLRGEGPLAMEEPYTYAARTYGPLRLVDYRCDRIADKGRCRAHRDVTVKLSNPVAPSELRAHLRLAGIPAMKAPPGAKLPTDPAAEHLLRIDPDSGKRYKVTLTAGLRDVFGQRLERNTSFEIETEAPFLLPSGQPPRPDAAVAEAPQASPAPDPDDLRARRAVLDYRVSVGMTGHVFEAMAAKGAHTIPVGTVNIPTYGMLTAALDEAQVRSWLGQPTASFLTQQSLAPTWLVPDAPENVRAVRGVNLDALLAPRKGYGAALLLLDVPGSGIAAQEMVSVTDLGISARFSPYGSLVWVTHLSTGEPVARARVSAYVRDEEKVTVETDDQGLALLPGDRFDPLNREGGYPSIRTDATLVVRAGDDWTFQRVERAAVDYRASGMYQDLSARAHWAGLLFTERGVYRPGETMKLAGILREVDPAGLRAVEKDVHVEVTDGNGASVFDGRAPLDRFGSFTLDVPLPHTAHLGDAHVSASVRAGSARGEFSRDFKLLAYKAREFKVDVDADRTSLVRGDEAVFHVESSYLFGAPMPHAPAHVALTRERAPFTPPGTDGFATVDDAYLAATRESESPGSALDDKDLELDESGRLTHKVRFDDPKQNDPERITFEAEVEDLTRQTVASRTSVLVHPAEFYAAVRVPDRLASAGTRIAPQVLAVEPAGTKRAGVAVQLELYERKWTTFVESQNGVAHRGWTSKDEVVGHCAATTRATPSGCELLLPEPGYFFVRATATDPRSHVVHASTGFYAVPPGDAPSPVVAWPDTDGRTLQLETNKALYAIGDQARILLKSPFKQAKALVTVERDGVLSRSVVDVSGPMPVVTVPITPALYPNAYVSVHLVRGRVQAPPESGPDLGAPDFRVGYAELKVDPEEHRLQVTIAPSRAKTPQPSAGKQALALVEYRPGETFEGDVTVADRQGKPVEGEVTFYAVDEGVLMLTGYTTPDPLPPFVERRRLAVFTGESREGLARVHPLKAGEKVPILGWEYASRVNESGEAKGDEGGDGAGAAALRADFRTTAFFEAGKVTSHEGKAHYSFKLPDNLTTFRLMAVVAGQDDRFGFGELPIVTSRPLMARPALPRIVRVGDSFEASVVLSGKRLGATNVSVELEAKGITLTGAARQQAALPAGGSV